MVLAAGERRYHDHRDARELLVSLHFLEERQPAATRHVQIEEDHVRKRRSIAQ
ncbi:MAG TPA: hypothetical protein VMK12_28325 [Anaeromyxobacteraceae bacterium]|nr:hypothetical protein [Anaeromyxobacteraceae bacterium]